jgi:hypothetical protein
MTRFVQPTPQFAASGAYTDGMPAALPLVTRQEIVRDAGKKTKRIDDLGVILKRGGNSVERCVFRRR